MLLKLITLLVLVHQLSACCLPDTFQMTILSETRFGGHGTPYRARIVMAVDAATGRAAVISHSHGYEGGMYLNVHTRRAHFSNPPYGCYESALDVTMLQHLNQSRCVPAEVRANATVIPIVLAGGQRARLFSAEMPVPGGYGSGANISVDAIVTEHCQPIMVKMSGDGYESTNVFGDFKARPEGGILDLPAACRNATVIGGSAATSAGNATTMEGPSGNGTAGYSRKRHPMHLPYVSRSLFYV